METTLDVEWASAMAPGSRVLVYAGTDASSTTLLRAYDRIVSENRAAVLTTSWGRCETDYPRAYLNLVDAVFLRAAAQGITVIAASGDAGGSLGAAIQFLFDRGAKDVTAICLLGTPEGVEAIEKLVGDRDVTLVLGALDERLNEKGYIVPGLGDAGDRLYGTV